MYYGLFWVMPGEYGYETPVVVPLKKEYTGESDLEKYTHRKCWNELNKSNTNGFKFDYYPRGRVQIRKGTVKVFLNPDINRKAVIRKIAELFDLDMDITKFISDGTSHYRYTILMDY